MSPRPEPEAERATPPMPDQPMPSPSMPGHPMPDRALPVGPMPSPWRAVARQVAYGVRLLWRDPQALFFSLALPPVLLVLFAEMFGNSYTRLGDGTVVRQSTYYVAAIVAFAIVDTAFVALLVHVVTQREMGLLRRRALTPEPGWVLTVGNALTAAVGCLITVAVLLALGQALYGVTIPLDTLPGVVATLVIGAAALCCLAYATSPFVRPAEAALPVGAALTLPLFFVSGVFVPWEVVPPSLQAIAELFPVRAAADAMVLSFDPSTRGLGYLGRDLAILALWGIVGLATARRWFRHTPTTH